MADPDLPKFLFDVPGWRSSRTIQRMSMAERGVYLEMLLEQWEKRNLPDSAEAVADAIATTDAQAAEVLAAWPVVRRKFITSRGDKSRIYNETMERTRRSQREGRRKRQDAGSKGGKSKAAKHTKESELQPSNATAMLSTDVAMLSDIRRVREGKEINVSRSNVSEGVTRQSLPDARSNRPIYKGQRLVVFEWMFDECSRILGQHLDDFNLDLWLDALDADCVRTGTVPPRRDNGEWLFGCLRAECQRRGLPIKFAASGPVLGKANTRLAQAVANIKAAEAV